MFFRTKTAINDKLLVINKKIILRFLYTYEEINKKRGRRHQMNENQPIKLFVPMKWWPETESNCRHKDFQSSALPTELPGHKEESD